MRKFLIILLISLLSISAYSADIEGDVERGVRSIERRKIEAQVAFLSSDSLRGRAAGSTEAAITAEYIASTMHGYGYDVTRQRFYVDSVKTKQGRRAVGSMTNILCSIEGVDTTQSVIIGAHYDHLGVTKKGEIFNGADDNASGVTAVLQIARAFKEAGIRPRRTIIFAFWDGEEIGSLGSKHYINIALRDTLRAISYMNFDMIGRNTDESRPSMFRYLYTASSPEFERYLRGAIDRFDLQLDPDYKPWDNPTTGSDNAPFARQGVPIAWFHTDGHADYHRVSDTADKINYQKLTEIIRAAFVVATQMAK